METEILDSEDFVNHLTKCRTCLSQFEIDDMQIKITPIVQLRFQELTQIQLKVTSDNLSNVICETCNSELRRISNFRKELIHKQVNLYELQDVKNDPQEYFEIKLEETEDPENYAMESIEYVDDVGSMLYGEDYSTEQKYTNEQLSVDNFASPKSKRNKSPKKFYKRFEALKEFFNFISNSRF
jgi:Zinc-finger associated domain (zf-AD)